MASLNRSSHRVDYRAAEHHAVRRLRDEVRNGLRLRHVDGVAPLGFDDGRTSALGHGTLRVGRDHLVVGRDEVPAWLRLPRRLRDGAVERVEAPRDLRVRHEGGRVSAHVRGERRGELRPIEKRKPSCGGRIGGTGAPGGGFLISADTDSPLSGAKAAM